MQLVATPAPKGISLLAPQTAYMKTTSATLFFFGSINLSYVKVIASIYGFESNKYFHSIADDLIKS